MMRGREFLGGLLLGALVGAVTGLLIAPQSGEETRNAMRDQAKDLGGKLRENSQHVIDNSRDLLEQGKAQVAEMLQSCREKVASLSEHDGGSSEEA